MQKIQHSRYFRFLRDNRQVLFSLVLVIVIPVLLVFNTLWLVRSMSQNIDYELRLRAEMAGQLVGRNVAEQFDDTSLVQQEIGRIRESSLFGAITRVEVLRPTDEGFEILASTNSDSVNRVEGNPGYILAWNNQSSIAQLVIHRSEGEERREWRVTSQILNEDGRKIGLVDISIDTAQIDLKTAAVLERAMIMLAVSILVVILLLASNAQLFEYALLFRKMQEVDHMKDDFISVASHELKTPVTAAKGFISLIQLEGEKLSKDTLDDLEKAKASLNRLGELVNDLLDVSRIEQNRLKLENQRMDVRVVLDEVVEQMRSMAEEKGIIMVYDRDAQTIPPISLDPSKYRQVLVNLISNAIKYTFEGEVRIRVEYQGLSKVGISVQDSGIGMSAQEVAQLFGKFYRVRNRRAKDVVGTGLGLWITKQLTEIMGGKIYVESVENIGSKFMIEFPIDEKVS